MEGRIKFSLCHATARLPEGWLGAYQCWKASASGDHDLEYILCVDERMVSKLQGLPYDVTLVLNQARTCAVDAWNKAAQAATGDVLITAADDWFPPPQWDRKLAAVLPDLGDHVVEVSTMGQADRRRLLTHSILTRSYYQRYGYVFYPEYFDCYADDEFTAQARRDGVVLDARHLVFPHHHPADGMAGNSDSVYRRKNGPAMYTMGREIYERRWSTGDKAPARKSVLVSVLCGPERHQWINPHLAHALLGWATDWRFQVQCLPAYNMPTVEAARNWATSRVLDGPYDYLLMVDNDTRPSRGNGPDQGLVNLLDLAALGLDVVAAPVPLIKGLGLYLNSYTMLGPDFVPSSGHDMEAALDYQGGLLERAGVGAAAICIHRTVLRALTESDWLPLDAVGKVLWPAKAPYPVWVAAKGRDGAVDRGEDLLFCQRARHLGFRVWTSLCHLCGHVHAIDERDIAEIRPLAGWLVPGGDQEDVQQDEQVRRLLESPQYVGAVLSTPAA